MNSVHLSQRCWLVIAAAMLLVGCQKKNQLQVPPPPKVTVAMPVTQEVVETMVISGTTEATSTVELRARISGYLEKINFQDGARVSKGDLLFVIEQAPYTAELDAAEANLQKAKAALQLADANLARTTKLAQEKATTTAQLDIQQAEKATAVANVAAAEVAVTQAKLNLSYTEIRAPINGLIGKRLVDEGNLVREGDMPLAIIQSIDPLYASFYLSEPELLRLMSMVRTHALPNPNQQPPELWLARSDEQDFPHEGYLEYLEPGVDPSTGTILRRGIFKNPNSDLVPGLHVRIKAEIGSPEPKVLVEERALGSDQRGSYLLTVNDKNIVQYRPVKLGVAIGKLRVIEEGLEADEAVVVNGLQRARPGSEVTPEREKMVASSDSVTPEADQKAAPTEEKPQAPPAKDEPQKKTAATE